MSAFSVLAPYRTILSLMKPSKKTQLSHPPNTASALLIDDLLLLKIFHLHTPAAQAKMAQSSAIYPVVISTCSFLIPEVQRLDLSELL